MAVPSKDTIYIDIDDEITGIIDKMNASKSKIVSLVLPKRATVLQSIVNMRLLKRAADESKKNVVLITSEASLMPLAGAAKMYVAKTLNSKPEIPTPPSADDEEETVQEDSGPTHDTEITAATAGAIAVGALAGLPPKDDMETVELEDDELPEAINAKGADAGTSDKPPKKDDKLKVPNFDRFRLLLIGGVCLLILLIGGFVAANKILPKATIKVGTNATNVNVTANMTIGTTTAKLDPTTSAVPAKQASIQKTYTQSATATGQLNNGLKATGSITVSVVCTAPVSSIPAGIGVSSNKLTYITTDTLKFGPGYPSGGHFVCSGDVPIKAQQGGTQYNLAANSTFSVAGYPSMTGNNSSALSGGTDNITTVVSQSDIDGAKAKIVTDDATIKQTLSTQLSQAGWYPITGTYNAGAPVVTTSANAGDAAANVTVTEVITYTMLGVHQADLKVLVDNNVKTQIDTSKQNILDEGFSTATYNVQSTTDTSAVVTMQTVAVVGPQLNPDAIKTEVAGKKTGDVKSLLQTNPDVTSVDVSYSPFWVTSVPHDTSKIIIIIAKPTKTTTTSNGTNP